MARLSSTGRSNELTPVLRQADARSILSKTCGFIAEAGFTHSLTPARNCTFGCTYCYVPTMRIQGGLRHEDWRRWGEFTTFKANAAELLRRELRSSQKIYCSPLVDPYQPAEERQRLMPAILQAIAEQPPKIFVLQTRGPLILRDMDLLRVVSQRTRLRVSFSLSTNREDIHRKYEPKCAPVAERLGVIRHLREAGIETYATLAPLLPSDIEELVHAAIEASGRNLIGDPLHVRASKPRGATTREIAAKISSRNGHEQWFEPAFQTEIVQCATAVARRLGYSFLIGTAGFACLSR